MRIGILTWWKNANYGGCLQGIALQRHISKIYAGVKLLDYEPLQSDLRWWQDCLPRDFFKDIKKLCRLESLKVLLRATIILFFQAYKTFTVLRIINTRRFLNQYAIKTDVHYLSEQQLNKQNEVDAIIVGSDQVWNPGSFCVDKGYLLANMPSTTSRIAYAPSIAAESIDGYENIFSEALKGFSAISVREKSGVSLLQRVSHRRIKWVVDPTLLLSSSEWLSMLKIRSRNSSRVFMYWLSNPVDICSDIKRFSDNNRCEIDLFVDMKSFTLPLFNLRSCAKVLFNYWRSILDVVSCRRVHVCKHLGPKGFIKKISSCSYVITNSYHGLLFGLIFRKPIKIIINKERKLMASRIIDLLERIGVDITPEDVFNADTDLKRNIIVMNNDAETKLQNWILESKLWLKEALQEL